MGPRRVRDEGVSEIRSLFLDMLRYPVKWICETGAQGRSLAGGIDLSFINDRFCLKPPYWMRPYRERV